MANSPTTAASIWNTGLIGVAVVFNRYEIALLLSAINYMTLHFVRHLKIPEDEKEPEG